ncbi:ABC transporter permease [Agrobacterium sp. V1]|uniref:ABC transporter permease n=1 Tax=Agrobacterium sp. V1 TaxID=3061957 RepID=UPI002673138E|nr:ABC transporter permease [Agrobacterium sp. V1]MDO3445480.1 ABC transporter permease [Agrobacterium sp. V1]
MSDLSILKTRPSLRERVFLSSSAKTYPHATAILLLLPFLAVLSAGFAYPLLKLIALSLPDFSPHHYLRIVREPLYFGVLMSTAMTAMSVMVAALFLGFPVAYAMTRLKHRLALVVTACVLIPLWTSVLIRSYAWIVILQRNGIINEGLVALGVVDAPLRMIYTQGAVILTMAHVLLPFMILPVFSALRAIPPEYVQAARTLGSGPVHAFVTITMPLALPGIFAGCVICFVLALGFYVTPALVGGPGSMMIATLIGQQTTVLLDWPFAAALSTVLLILTLTVILIFRKTRSLSKGLNGGV